MYINSPGGGFTSLMAIYDTMQYVRADIQTVCLGQAASAAAVLLAAGTPGKRMALPNARVLIHQPSLSGVIQGQFSDLEIQAAEIERMRTLMETTLAHHTGRDAATIRKDTDRDKILTAARGQGLRDHRHRAGVPEALRADRLTVFVSWPAATSRITPTLRPGAAHPSSRNRVNRSRRDRSSVATVRSARSPVCR